MSDIKIEDKDKKHNKKRTKTAQKGEITPTTKRRVNISIDGRVWDKLKELDIKNRSVLIEELLKKEIKKASR